MSDPIGARPLTLAIPKGRLARALAPRLEALGVTREDLSESDRRLVRETSGPVPLRLLMLKPDDVPTYVEHGAADLGVVGRDVLLERQCDAFVPLDLAIGRCRMVVAAPCEADRTEVRPASVLRVATKYPRIAKAHFATNGTEVEVIYVGGSVELAPLVGLADLIVDLVETGETLRQNGLVVRETVCEVSAVVLANRVSYRLRRSETARVLEALETESTPR